MQLNFQVICIFYLLFHLAKGHLSFYPELFLLCHLIASLSLVRITNSMKSFIQVWLINLCFTENTLVVSMKHGFYRVRNSWLSMLMTLTIVFRIWNSCSEMFYVSSHFSTLLLLQSFIRQMQHSSLTLFHGNLSYNSSPWFFKVKKYNALFQCFIKNF